MDMDTLPSAVVERSGLTLDFSTRPVNTVSNTIGSGRFSRNYARWSYCIDRCICRLVPIWCTVHTAATEA